MRIIVYGAGAIGGLTGGFLARAGQNVILIGRENNIKVINEKGLKIVSPLGRISSRYRRSPILIK